MRSTWAVCILALMLCTSSVEAKGFTSSHVSGRSGFSRGFSATKPSGSSADKSGGSASKTVFGSFGTAKPAPAPMPSNPTGASPSKPSRMGMFSSNAPANGSTLAASNKSALSSGLDRNAAQANALKTFDARNSSQTAGAAAATPGTDFGRSSQAGNTHASGATGTLPPVQPQPTYAPTQTIIVRDSGSSWGSNLMWFMLGRSMSDHRHYDAPYAGSTSAPYPGGPQATDFAAPHESFGWTFLRIFLWLAIISAIGWGIWLYVRRKGAQAARRHYTL